MSDCIFCKIINGEIPSQTIFENDKFKVILDAFPANKGHVLVLPKAHAENAFDIGNELAAEAFGLAVRVAKAMSRLDFAEGINILQNNGSVSGQTVYHFHIHIIPRFKGDTVIVAWKPGSYSEGEAEEFGQKLAQNM